MASQRVHKGSVIQHVSSGGGILALGNNVGIKFIAHDNQWVTIQILYGGIDVAVGYQHWRKEKTIKEKVVVEKIVKPQKKVKEYKPIELKKEEVSAW